MLGGEHLFFAKPPIHLQRFDDQDHLPSILDGYNASSGTPNLLLFQWRASVREGPEILLLTISNYSNHDILRSHNRSPH